jgi:hypothetical protein
VNPGPKDQTSSESELEDMEPLEPPRNKKPTRGQPSIQIDDIQAEVLNFHDGDVDITMGKDLEKRGIKPSSHMEDFWPQAQIQQSEAKPSQFHGMVQTISYCVWVCTDCCNIQRYSVPVVAGLKQ